MIEPGRYRRRVPTVRTTRITADNLDEVAAWCNGRVAADDLGQPVLYVGDSRIPRPHRRLRGP